MEVATVIASVASYGRERLLILVFQTTRWCYADDDNNPCRYFIFKCDEEDDYEYRMQYSDVWKFADENQPESFLLPKEMPTKYVDHKLHILCMFGHDQLIALDRARIYCSDLMFDCDVKRVFEVLEKRLSTHKVLELIEELPYACHMEPWGYSRSTIDKDQIEKKFLDRRNVLLVNHATEIAGEYIRSQTVTPALAADLMSRFCAAQGRGLPWSDIGKGLSEDRIKRFKAWLNSNSLIF